jgi:hypothetical protein
VAVSIPRFQIRQGNRHLIQHSRERYGRAPVAHGPERAYDDIPGDDRPPEDLEDFLQ